MKKLDSIIRLWYPLFFGLGIFASTLLIRYQVEIELKKEKISHYEKMADFLNNYLFNYNNALSKEEIEIYLNDSHNLILPVKQIMILSPDLKILYCKDKVENHNNKFVLRDCSEPYKQTELKDFKEINDLKNQNQSNNTHNYKLTDYIHDYNKHFYFSKKYPHFIIRLAGDYSGIQKSLSTIETLLIILSLIALFIIILSNYYLTKIITRPLKDITSSIKQYLVNSGERLSYSKIEEIAFLQFSINEVAKEIDYRVLEVTQRKEQVETVIKNISEGVLILDNQLKVILYNIGLFDVLNINPQIFKNTIDEKYYYEIIRINKLVKLIDDAAASGNRMSENIHLSRLNPKILKVTAIPLPKDYGMVVLIDDITEQYKLQEIKKSFVENASHEFKTPISIIKGYIETLLKSKQLNFIDQEKFLTKILRSTDRLSNLIKDLITLSKLDESKAYFNKEIVNIFDVTENCIDILSSKADEKNIALVNTIEEEDIELMGNPELMETILFNLIDNGITYADEGGTVMVEAYKKNDQVVVKVTDNGIGIPKEARERVFERFYRVDEGRSRKSGGTGLGLSIVKHAVIFHDGIISCDASPHGKGTQFKVIFPNYDYINHTLFNENRYKFNNERQS